MKLKTNTSKGLLYLVALLISTFISCTKNTYDFNTFASNQWNPQFATALVNGTLGINNFNLTDSNSYLQIVNDSVIKFVWSGNICTFHTSDFIPGFSSDPVIDTISLNANQQLGLSQAAIGSTYTISATQVANLSAQKASQLYIDSIKLKTGTFSVGIKNTFNDLANVTITIPGIIKGGSPYTTQLSIKPLDSSTAIFDISNMMIDMTDRGTTSNYLAINYSVTFKKTSSSTAGRLIFSNQINNPSLKVFYGDVRQQNFFTNEVQKVPLNIFKYKQKGGSLKLNDATISLSFINTFGVPLGFTVTQLKGINANNDSFYLNVGGIAPAPFIIPASPSLGVQSNSELLMDKNNPIANGKLMDIPTFLSNLPTAFLPKFDAVSNPGLSSTKFHNFILDTSKGIINAKITVPLNLNLTNYYINDTFPYTFSSVQNVQSFTLRTYFTNGFPVGITSKLVFVDAHNKPIYTLDATDSALITPATVGSNGLVTAPSITQHDFLLDGTIVPNLDKVKNVIFTGTISSPGNGAQPAIIYPNYTLGVKIGAKATIKN